MTLTDGHLNAVGVCLSFGGTILQGQCNGGAGSHHWELDEKNNKLTPKGVPEVCLTRKEATPVFDHCLPEKKDLQTWIMAGHV